MVDGGAGLSSNGIECSVAWSIALYAYAVSVIRFGAGWSIVWSIVLSA